MKMKITQIQYTARAEYVLHNQENISRVMAELRALNPKGVRYSSFLKEDGKTFVHLVISTDEEASEIIPELKSFQRFQKELGASGFEIEPEVSELTLVGSSIELL
jgi:hypothetical protein